MQKWLLWFGLLLVSVSQAQVNQVEFGQNRVLYTRQMTDWSKYETRHFTMYWYPESRQPAIAALQFAETDIKTVRKLLEYHVNQRFDIVVYADAADLRQTGIQVPPASLLKRQPYLVYNDAIVVCYDGSLEQLRTHIRAGITKLMLNHIFDVNNIQELVTNTTGNMLPEWFTEGLIAFVSHGWTAESKLKVEEILGGNPPTARTFHKFAVRYPNAMGLLLWSYIERIYGQQNITNIIYLTRINRNSKTSFQYVLSKPFDRLVRDALEDWLTTQNTPIQTTAVPDELPKLRNWQLAHVVHSGTNLKAAVTYRKQRARVYLHDGRSWKLIKRIGLMSERPTYDGRLPLATWHPNGRTLAVAIERGNTFVLLTYDTQTKKWSHTEFPYQIQFPHLMTYSDPNTLILSSTSAGVSDIFKFDIPFRQLQRITQDHYDDLTPVPGTIAARQGISFLSNRPKPILDAAIAQNDTLLTDYPTDVFTLFFNNPEQKVVRWTSDTRPKTQLVRLDAHHIAYLANVHNQWQPFVAVVDSFIPFYRHRVYYTGGRYEELQGDSVLLLNDTLKIDSIFTLPVWHLRATSHVLQHDLTHIKSIFHAGCADSLYVLVQSPSHRGKATKQRLYKIPVKTSDVPKPVENNNDVIRAVEPELPEPEDFIAPFPKIYLSNPLIDTFANGFKLRDSLPTNTYGYQQQPAPYKLRALSAPAYIPAFRLLHAGADLNNTPLFGGLQSYAISNGRYQQQPISLMNKVKFDEILQNHLIEAGFRVPFVFNAFEGYVRYKDMRARTVKQYGIYRRQATQTTGDNVPISKIAQATDMVFAEWQYPFDRFKRLTLHSFVRQDRGIRLATDTSSLRAPNNNEQRLGFRTEYVYDNTEWIMPNMPSGLRGKVWCEGFYMFSDPFNRNSQRTSASVGYLGADIRAYQEIHRYAVAAVRLAAARGLGNGGLLFMIGGSDGEPANNLLNNIVPASNIAFLAPAPSLRGHRLNAQQGTSYFLINSELRISPVTMATGGRTTNLFWRHMQVVGFFDIGTAWFGSTPFSSANPANIIVLPANPTPNNPVTLEVVYTRPPFIMGTGAGLRCTLLGMQLRLDCGAPIRNRQLRKPIYHFAVGFDF